MRRPKEERLMDEAIKSQATTWAERTVARYAQAVEPEMSSDERGKLQDDLAAALQVAMLTKPLPEWVNALNSVLDQWERDNHHSGPRVHDFDIVSERVVMRSPETGAAGG